MLNKWWKRSLALSLGLLVSGVRAEENAWRVPPGQARESARSSGPAVTLGSPIVVRSEGPSGSGDNLAASLGKPVPIGGPAGGGNTQSARIDGQVRPISFSGNQVEPSPLSVQSSAGDLIRPATTAADSPKPSTINPLFTYTRDQDEVAPPPRVESSPAPRSAPMGEMFPIPPQDGQTFADMGTPVITDGPGLVDGEHFAGNAFYISAEGLLWWMKGYRTPPLATTYPDNASIPQGTFGSPGTQVVLGNALQGSNSRGGARVMLGYWFDDEHLCGVDAGFLYLGQRNQSATVNSFGTTNLAVPLGQVTTTGFPGVYPIAGLTPFGALRDVGSVSLVTRSTLTGGELNWRTNLVGGPNGFIDGIVGFRALELNEDLTFGTTTSGNALANFLGRGVLTVPGSAVRTTSDFFKTQNNFYGAQVGLLGEWHEGAWVFTANTKLGIGSTQQMVTIRGSTVDTLSGGGGSFAYPVGLFAATTNSGLYTRNKLTFLPEMGGTVGYQFTEHLRGFVGYNFMYLSNVVRPGDQINRVINPNQLPTFGSGVTPNAGNPAQPSFVFHDSSFWAQGVSVGFEWRF